MRRLQRETFLESTLKTHHLLPGLAAAFCLASAPVHATPVKWHLVDVTFNDGGSASGYFTYDASTNAISSANIVTTAGSVRGGATYQIGSPAVQPALADFIDQALPVIVGTTDRLDFFLFAAMTDAGGTIGIRQGQEFSCISSGCSFTTGQEAGLNLRVSGGEITTVPEPGSLALLGAAGIALALAKRRRPAP